MRKMKMRPARPAAGAPQNVFSNQLMSQLEEIERLSRNRRWAEALSRAEALRRQYPQRIEVLSTLMMVSYEAKNIVRYVEAAEEMAQLQPNRREVQEALGTAYLLHNLPALGLRACRACLQRWPHGESADIMRETIASVEAQLPRILEQMNLPPDEGEELAIYNERVQLALERNNYAETKRIATEGLRRFPAFPALLNNLGQAHYAEGNIQEAIAVSQQTLDAVPDNVHALCNLARFAVLRGQFGEAQAYITRAEASQVPAHERSLKLIESLSYLGDDAEVDRIFREADHPDSQDTSSSRALFQHLGAVAALRLGDESEARRRWKQALRLSPGHNWSQANLEDLNQPIEERDGPWAFPLYQWVYSKDFRELSQVVGKELEGKEEKVKQAIQKALQKCPEMIALVPLLLDRGDPYGRAFACLIATLLMTPELQTALYNFGLSQMGPDQLRIQVMTRLMQSEFLEEPQARLWVKGEWVDVLLLAQEIYYEPETEHSPEVTELVGASMEKLYDGDGATAEKLLKQALLLEPNSPTIRNNLASAYMQQGKHQEADQLLDEVFERFPDYLFGQANYAARLAREGKIEEARKLLEPFTKQPRLHASEFVSLCMAQIDIELAAGNQERARLHLRSWEQVAPDHPHLLNYRARVESLSLPESFGKLQDLAAGMFRKRRREK